MASLFSVLAFLCAAALPRGGSGTDPASAGAYRSLDRPVHTHGESWLAPPRDPAAEDLGSIVEPDEKSDPRELPPSAAAPGRLPRPSGSPLRPSPADAAHAFWPAAPRLRC